jgi:hypothetical protein
MSASIDDFTNGECMAPGIDNHSGICDDSTASVSMEERPQRIRYVEYHDGYQKLEEFHGDSLVVLKSTLELQPYEMENVSHFSILDPCRDWIRKMEQVKTLTILHLRRSPCQLPYDVKEYNQGLRKNTDSAASQNVVPIFDDVKILSWSKFFYQEGGDISKQWLPLLCTMFPNAEVMLLDITRDGLRITRNNVNQLKKLPHLKRIEGLSLTCTQPQIDHFVKTLPQVECLRFDSIGLAGYQAVQRFANLPNLNELAIYLKSIPPQFQQFNELAVSLGTLKHLKLLNIGVNEVLYFQQEFIQFHLLLCTALKDCAMLKAIYVCAHLPNDLKDCIAVQQEILQVYQRHLPHIDVNVLIGDPIGPNKYQEYAYINSFEDAD